MSLSKSCTTIDIRKFKVQRAEISSRNLNKAVETVSAYDLSTDHYGINDLSRQSMNFTVS